MTPSDEAAFKQMFRDACGRCFGTDHPSPLTAAESRVLCAHILEETGMTLGWKTVQTYSLHLHLDTPDAVHPTGASLETLARYVLGAPRVEALVMRAALPRPDVTPEVPEGRFPYWFQYRDGYRRRLPVRLRRNGVPGLIREPGLPDAHPIPRGLAKRFWFYTFRGAGQVLSWSRRLVPEYIRHSWLAWLAFVLFVGLTVIWSVREYYARRTTTFTDSFAQVDGDSLQTRGWTRLFPDGASWDARGATPGALTLFTLKGDNWPDSADAPYIGNLLMRPINGECFTAEVQFSEFTPTANWQQAGLLLLEDSTLSSRSIRISIAYNDYFEDYVQPRQIIVEGISSAGTPTGKPEEILHKTLYLLGWGKDSLIRESMRHTALRIEKRGTTYRFLYAGGQTDNFVFQEVGTHSLYITPRYIALFALRGNRGHAADMPVDVRLFRLQIGPCEP